MLRYLTTAYRFLRVVRFISRLIQAPHGRNPVRQVVQQFNIILSLRRQMAASWLLERSAKMVAPVLFIPRLTLVWIGCRPARPTRIGSPLPLPPTAQNYWRRVRVGLMFRLTPECYGHKQACQACGCLEIQFAHLRMEPNCLR